MKWSASARNLCLFAGLLWAPAGLLSAPAVRIADVKNTPHNLSMSNPSTSATAVKSTSETQVCVFCHTPHGATPNAAPLWNKALSTATYTPYTSSSLQAETIYGQLAQPGGTSKLCLSCHDGTLAVAAVNVMNNKGSRTAQSSGVAPDVINTGPGGTMPVGAGALTGFTRDLGVDLTNDHPISLTYDAPVANANGELRVPDANQDIPPASGAIVGVRKPGHKPMLPLEATGPAGIGQIQCGTCHDAHIRDASGGQNIKFLRANRFQEGQPTGAGFDPVGDNMCIACHDKAGMSWAYSAHANPQVATQLFNPAAAALYELPPGLPVWQAACLNCHDAHTVQGARRLLREGTDSTSIPKSGGNSAIEETCYQCHSNLAQSIVTPTTTVPDIKTDYQLPRHMPITSLEQPAGSEVHDIGTANNDVPTQRGKDLIESPALLGNGNVLNRHAECTDCHNPHRVVKFNQFIGANGVISGPPDASGSHNHNAPHTNIASGVLRGAWGVEPTSFASTAFGALPISYAVKRGDPGNSLDTTVAAAHLTREYQVCLKCHSDYGFGLTPPTLGATGGTLPGTNGLSSLTNQAMEFQAPLTHQGEVTGLNSGAGGILGGVPDFVTNNHRSWHPVMDLTGRSALVRNMSASTDMFMSPWDGANIGSQTMYCSDCHGSDTGLGGTAAPIGSNPWGPHGSTNDFILKGSWNSSTGIDASGICFKCHSYVNYATSVNAAAGNNTGNPLYASGFGCAPTTACGAAIATSTSTSINAVGRPNNDSNLHALHAQRLGRNLKCMWCHAAVPHGFKNKGLVVNLNDVGSEAAQVPATEIATSGAAPAYTKEAYYAGAVNKVITFATSGNWTAANCGSAGSAAVGNDPGTGTAWMASVCSNPP
jgi:hypothetical protein